MNCTYQKQCSSIIECIGFLEHYVNEQSYLHAMTSIEHTYSGTFLQEELLTQLDQLTQALGTWMDQHMPQARDWFTILQEEACNSMMKIYVLETIDLDLIEIPEQINHMKAQHAKQPLMFLRMMLSLFEEDPANYETYTYDDLLNALEQTDYDDQIKWKILKFHLTLPNILDEFLILLEGIMPILQEYRILLDQCLQIYLNDYETYQDNLLTSFTKQHEMMVGDQDRPIYIIPTVAYGHSFIYHESDIDPNKSSIVLWGVDVLQTTKNLGQASSSEAICSVLKVISDKSKFEILCYLSKHKTAYGAEIAKAMNLTTATISYHMQALITTHLIKIEKSNHRLYYSVNETVLKHFLQTVERHILMP